MPSDLSGNYNPETLKQLLGELLGLARGLLADQELSDSEIEFLQQWLEERYAMTSSFPGNVIYNRIKEVLADGIVTEDERDHLVETLNMLIEGRLEDLTEQLDLTELWFDEIGLIEFHETRFCLTGNFVYGPKEICKTAIEQRGGLVSPTVDNEPEFLIVGALGVDAWRSGGLGAEIEQAMRLKARGIPVKIISEDAWVSQLKDSSA
jgi:NAD-dependent DNA ligase